MSTIINKSLSVILVLFLIILSFPVSTLASDMAQYRITGKGQGNVVYPSWFKESFLDLGDDLEEAQEAGKRGIIVMFSRKNCSHCQALIETTFSDSKIIKRVQSNYDVIAVDIFSDNEVTYIDGTTTTVKNFAETSKARLTPTLIFLGVEKKPLLKIIGFYPPDKFEKVLDYIDGDHYKNIKLSQYLRKQDVRDPGDKSSVNYDYSLFSRPPHDFSTTPSTSIPVTIAFFEKPNCTPCVRFHERALDDSEVQNLMKKFNSIQLDSSDTKSVLKTPDGKKLSPSQWSRELQLNYDYSLVFFDENGKEVHRMDSEVSKDLVLRSMHYVSEKAYEHHEQYMQWEKEQALLKTGK